MSNELYNTIARVTDGIYEGIYMLILSSLLCFCKTSIELYLVSL